MVAVKDRHEVAAAVLFQRMVDVARFGVFIRGTHHIVNANAGGERAKLGPVAIIQQIDVKPIFRPVDTQRGVKRRPDHTERFVIGRNQQIHRRPQRTIGRHRNRLTVERP